MYMEYMRIAENHPTPKSDKKAHLEVFYIEYRNSTPLMNISDTHIIRKSATCHASQNLKNDNRYSLFFEKLKLTKPSKTSGMCDGISH